MFGHDNNHRDDSVVAPQDEATAPLVQEDTIVPVVAPADNQTAADDDSHKPQDGFVATPAVAKPAAAAPAPGTDDLLDIKQEALQALTPLVGQLDQSPEEEFRTTMMMIQASDNHALVKVAYEAAKKIANEKERAQALLDIVNEINYFTQQS